MKDYCECCGSNKGLIEQDALRRDNKTIDSITICTKCLTDYKTHRF